MKSRWKKGLYFGIYMGAVLILFDALFEKGLGDHPAIKIASYLVAGFFSGLLFEWLMGKFTRSAFVKKTTRINIPPGTHIIYESLANHFRGLEAVGGKLFMTETQLIFHAHGLNIQRHELKIGLNEIREVRMYRPLGITRNGLLVQTINDAEEKFVVDDPAKWMEQLELLRAPSVKN